MYGVEANILQKCQIGGHLEFLEWRQRKMSLWISTLLNNTL
jgi:hypothetical protein